MSLILTADKNPGTASWSTTSFSHGISDSGTATILNGATSVIVNVDGSPPALQGSLVLATFSDSPTNALTNVIWATAVDGAGNMTINVNVDPQADLTVSYAVLTAL